MKAVASRWFRNDVMCGLVVEPNVLSMVSVVFEPSFRTLVSKVVLSVTLLSTLGGFEHNHLRALWNFRIRGCGQHGKYREFQ